ncbi:nuclear pore complex subunit [Podospora pseudoanserina]|uniref:Nuclear pore complex subunit n=1 Tax=Podospora pseudoanserina TaxID=2609844 RepID=A0ABR0IDB0_9PEZI|nr:nuclear pore complex subunit [Podospora pseudoanserina]
MFSNLGKGTPPVPLSTGSLAAGTTNPPATTAGGLGSLFSKPATPTTTTTGLFSNPNPTAGATSTTPQKSLFGGTTTTTTSTPLFGSTTTAAAPAATTATTGGGIFGNTLGGSTTPQTSVLGGGFGGGLGTTQQQQSNLGGSLASILGPTTQQPAGGMNTGFGNTLGGASVFQNAAMNPPSLTGSFFDSLLSKNKKQASGETPQGDLPSLQLSLSSLRQTVRKLAPKDGEGGRNLEHGKAHYFLAASGVDPGAAVRDLSSLGFAAAATATTRDRSPYSAGEADVETYLDNLQTKTTLSMIADGLERSVRDFDLFLEDNVTMEWEAQRKRIYQHFGIKPREEQEGGMGDSQRTVRGGTPAKEQGAGGFGRSRRKGSMAPGTPGGGEKSMRQSMFGRSAMNKSVIGTPSRIGAHAPEFSDVEARKEKSDLEGFTSVDDRFLREKQGKLATKIKEFNDLRQRGLPVEICKELGDLENTAGDRHGPHLVEAYDALREIVGENDPDNLPRERQFARYYLDPNPSSANSIEMRKRILKGANTFLEKQFWAGVNSFITKHPHEANLGGQPDVVSKVKAYIRLRLIRKSLVPDNVDLQQANGEYVWAIVFYLLRAGFVNDAAKYVNDHESLFRSIDRTFMGYINSYASSEDRRLKRSVQDRCTNEYNQRIRNAPEGSIDPFRMACYKIIGRCDVNNRSLDGLSGDVNDWVWLQFNLARETDRSQELAGESYGLAELQSSIREIGLKHFPKTPAEDTTGSFAMFFYLQILSGMFENAIAYLYSFSYVDAVHFAIALSYYGLLRAADAQSSGNDLLSHNTRNQPQINFGRMLGYYTRDFRAANAAAAVDYLVLICLNADETAAGQQQAALCHEALRELVLESREFSRLIGDIKPDGSRIKGLIEERGKLIALGRHDDFIRNITQEAAAFANDNGRTTDAVLLYHLAQEYNQVVEIVSRALSEAISLEIGEEPMRLVPVMAREDGQEEAAGSLAAIDDPVELAKKMMKMYEQEYMYWNKIGHQNQYACNLLLQISDIKKLVEDQEWAKCLDKIEALNILPLDAKGDQSLIRQYSALFAQLPQTVAQNVPNLLMWAVVCCTKQRERLMYGQFTGNETTARELIDNMKQTSVDLTAYTSQLRYRLPSSLHEMLARASAD